MPTATEIVQFTLTVKGRPVTPDPNGISEWFDTAHNAIRTNFYEATTRSMHKLWGLKEGK